MLEDSIQVEIIGKDEKFSTVDTDKPIKKDTSKLEESKESISKEKYEFFKGIKTIKLENNPAFSKPYYNPYIKNQEMDKELYPGKNSIIETFEHACNLYKNKTIYKYRNVIKEHIEKDEESGKNIITYEYGKVFEMTYDELHKDTRYMANGIRQFCPNLKPGGRFGIYLDTSREWYITAMSNLLLSHVNVTCYASLGEKNLKNIINEGELSVVLCPAKSLKFMDTTIAKQCKSLQKLVVVGKSDYQPTNLEIINWEDLISLGKKNFETFKPIYPSKEDLAFIMYTSGTTGRAKGVMLAHENIVAALAGMNRHIPIKPSDVHLSYLPLSHIFELVIHTLMICSGALIAFGNPRTLMAKKGGALKKGDLVCYRPTLLIGVPKVYDTIRKGVFALVHNSSKLKRWLFNHVFNFKIKHLKNGKKKNHFLEKLVFGKLRKKLGGRIRLVAAGGSLFSSESQLFMQAVLPKKVSTISGYALSESSSATSAQEVGKFVRPDEVGISLGNSKFRLMDCPNLGYFVKDNKGEIIISGNSISKGYYKQNDKTIEAYFKDENGEIWFHSGDVGEVTKFETLSIIDRVKNLVKLSNGEYVALEHNETIFCNSNFVQPNGCFIYANSLKSYCVGIVLVDTAYIKEFAKENEIHFKTISELLKNKKIIQEVQKSFKNLATEYKLKSCETVTKIALFDDVWTPESGLLTASYKKKRNVIAKKYKETLDELYA